MTTRNNKGQLEKGSMLNPEGRPLGSFSLVNLLRKELLKTPEGQKKTYAKLLIARVLKSAIQDGDTLMIKDIMNRIDGMPKQSINATSNGETLKGLIEVNYGKKKD